MRFVIAYDVSDDRRRHQVSQFLLGWGRRVQKSVFECDISRGQLIQVVTHLKGLLRVPPDRCHIYRLCAECASSRQVLGTDLEAEWGRLVVT